MTKERIDILRLSDNKEGLLVRTKSHPKPWTISKNRLSNYQKRVYEDLLEKEKE